jgi:hypothetical protein
MAKSLEDQKKALTMQLIALSGVTNILIRRRIQRELDRINARIKKRDGK